MPTAMPTDAAGFNTLTTSVMEKYHDPTMMQDAVFEAVPLFNIVNKLGLVNKSELPHDLVVRVLFDKAEGVVPFNGYDVVPTTPSKGAQAALFRVAQYSGPLQMSMVEELELTSPQAFADAIADRIEQLELTFAEELARDMYGGNSANAKRILGLEDVCQAATHLAVGGGSGADTDPIRKKWQVRQHANSYGGITRTAWTAANRGTGWEANVLDGGSATGAFGLSSGVPNNFTQRFGELYSVACTHGTIQPNLILMSPQPYADYENMCLALEQPRRSSAEFGNFTFGKDTLMHKKAIIVQDEFAETQVGPGTVDAIGSQNIYLLNTKWLSLEVDSRMDFSMGPPRSPYNQHAAVRYMYWRGQWKVKNPRYFGRVFDYNNTGA